MATAGTSKRDVMLTLSVETLGTDEIAKLKMPDLNTLSEESAASQVRGTAVSMGLTVEG